MANEDVLKMQHSYRCTPEKLFDAWLDPALVGQFMCPGAMHVSHLEWQAKVGGQFRVDMTEGDKTVPHRGRFLEIDRPKRLVFTWSSPVAGEDTRVTLDFKAQQDRTLLTLTHERLPSKEAIAMHREGWSGILDKLTPIFS
jgi:uncharacterized protein YndB with AHSA1/START domain